MIKLDKNTTKKLTELCEKAGYDLRDMSALLWGLIMQTGCHQSSVEFEREFPGHERAVISFDTKEQISAHMMLSLLHRSSDADPVPSGLSFSDELYRGVAGGYIEADGGSFSLEDGCLILSIKESGEDELSFISALFAVLAEEIADYPDDPLNGLRRVRQEDVKDIVALSKGDDMPYDRSKTWLDLFRDQVVKAPDRLAVSASNGDLTYRELDEASDRVASYILRSGAARGDFIAIMTGRVKEYVIGVVGIQKAGCAYVPIDTSYPKARIDYMLEDSSAAIILDEAAIENASKTEPVDLPKVSPEDTAYMIYTSGSTGNPKGAMIGHSALINFVLAIIRLNGLSEKDRVAAHRSFSFDAHIEDYFPTLSVGASVYIMPEKIRRDAGEIVSFLDKHGITGCGFTTSVAKLLINGHRLNVRYITCGGEALTAVTASGVEIINKYGPTEFTNDSTGYKLEKGMSYNVVPIGRPFPNCYAFVVDPFLNLLPKGTPGELFMAGVQIGKGYLGKPEKTKAAIMDCPFVKGIRMYRTGDIVRYMEDGNLTFIGRADDQVKLNGYRIELGEIEARCGEYEGVKEAVALIREIQGSRHLILYYVAKDNAVADTHRLRSHMESGALPQYMYPEIYMKLDKMPRLPNGKISKRDLPLPEFAVNTKNEAPKTALETSLLDAAKKVLPGITFGVTDDLFDLGMTSIGAMKFITLANRLSYPTKYKVGDIMRYRNISALIEGNRRVCYLYNESYDPLKPVLVFIYGVAPVSGTLSMLDLWTKNFDVFVIEPIDSHYDVLFEGPDYREIENMYLTILDNRIPGGLSAIRGLAGFSWGGFVAYTLAAAICRDKKTRPFVLMGDTDFNESVRAENSPGRDLNALPDDLFDQTNGAITKIEAIKRLSLVSDINRTVKAIPGYDGPVTLLDAALIRAEDDKKKHDNKIILAKQYASSLSIVEFPGHNHDDLFYDASLAPVYTEEMKKMLNGSANGTKSDPTGANT